jgi:hypothetical protein
MGENNLKTIYILIGVAIAWALLQLGVLPRPRSKG